MGRASGIVTSETGDFSKGAWFRVLVYTFAGNHVFFFGLPSVLISFIGRVILQLGKLRV